MNIESLGSIGKDYWARVSYSPHEAYSIKITVNKVLELLKARLIFICPDKLFEQKSNSIAMTTKCRSFFRVLSAFAISTLN